MTQVVEIDYRPRVEFMMENKARNLNARAPECLGLGLKFSANAKCGEDFEVVRSIGDLRHE